MTPGTGTIQNYTYDTTYPDRLKNFNGKGIVYNTLHCPTNYDGKSWTWTKGKLTRVRRGSANQPGSEYKDCTFTYDGYGRRINKHYIYDPNPAVAGDGNYYYDINYSYDESGRLIREFCTTHYDDGTDSTREFIFLYDESGIIGTMYSLNGAVAQPYYYRRNVQGDVIAIYDKYGSRKAEYAYDAFGNCTVLYAGLADLANNNPIRYRGYYYDKETNLYYLNSRYYNPEWRRFISPDSTEYIDPETPNGLNLYAYCHNDPVNYADPSGHFIITTTMLLSAIGLGAAIGAGIGLGATVAKDLKNGKLFDGDVTFLSYLGNTIGGGIAGMGTGLCSLLGAGIGISLVSGTALTIGGTVISGGAALAIGVGGAFIAGGLSYPIKTSFSDEENFEWTDMFIDAGANAISGLLSFTGAMVGGITGVKIPGEKIPFKHFALYHLGSFYFGVYPVKILLSRIKSILKERY